MFVWTRSVRIIEQKDLARLSEASQMLGASLLPLAGAKTPTPLPSSASADTLASVSQR